MRKQKCKGTIYKINNKTYCVGEKKSKKYKKSKMIHKSIRVRVKMKKD
jgi:hypothetical protein